MKVYFLSEQPAALYVGGAYFGRVSNFERFAEISLEDGMPVRFDAEGMQPIQFFLDEKLPYSPPNRVDVYRLPDGLALYARDYVTADANLFPIAQAEEGESLATVYRQGGIQLALNTPKGFFNAPLPPSFYECKLFFKNDTAVLQSPSEIAVFSDDGKRLLLERYLSAEWQDEELTLLLPLSDQLRRTAICRYRFSSGCAELISYALQQGDGNDSGLLAYAFFESVRIGADFTAFLCEELLPNADTVREFLGNFLNVLPTATPTECLLVYKTAERTFDVRKFAVTISDGKITDVSG